MISDVLSDASQQIRDFLEDAAYSQIYAGRLRVDRSLWLDEYGYQTNPPDPFLGVSPARQDQWLQEAAPDVVHLLFNGRIAKSGGPELAEQLESEGYEGYAQ